MATEDLPGEFQTFQRDETAAQYRRDYKLRNPGALTGPGTQPDLDARLIADQVMPLYNDAKLIGDGIDEEKAIGVKLDAVAERLGLKRTPAVGGSGFVTLPNSTPGGTIFSGDEIFESNSGLRFRCTVTAAYGAGDQVPIRGLDTGPGTNLKSATVMQWRSPRPGIPANAIVFEDVNGNGITGGANEQSDEQLREVVREHKRNPPAGDNDANVQRVVQATPDVAVERAFTYPAILGPGTTAVCFTLRPGKPGGARIPNPAQIAAVQANAAGQLAGDFSLFVCALIAQQQDIVLRTTYESRSQGFVDISPWPPYQAPASAVRVVSATNADAFMLETADGIYTGVADPTPGQTIGFSDATTLTAYALRKKKIKTVTGTGPWTITTETAENASDRTYTPAVGQRAFPWSDSHALLLPALVRFFDSLGPGEQVAAFMGPGRRQRRQPESPKQFPNLVTNDLICRQGADGEPSMLDVDGVADIQITEGLGSAASPGVAAVSANILQLRHFSVFPI